MGVISQEYLVFLFYDLIVTKHQGIRLSDFIFKIIVKYLNGQMHCLIDSAHRLTTGYLLTCVV